MTDYTEQAEDILRTASMLRHEDAVKYVAVHIEKAFAEGEKAGLIEGRMSGVNDADKLISQLWRSTADECGVS